MKHFQIRSRPRLQDRIVDGEDSPEPMDSGSSSDNEVYPFMTAFMVINFLLEFVNVPTLIFFL